MLKNLLFVACILTLTTACKNDEVPEVKTVDTSANMTHVVDPNATYAKAEFEIDGMTCAVGCARTIERKIAKMDGVKYAKVDFDKKLAMVEYDQAKVTPTDLETTVTKVGDAYSVKDMKTVKEFSEK